MGFGSILLRDIAKDLLPPYLTYTVGLGYPSMVMVMNMMLPIPNSS